MLNKSIFLLAVLLLSSGSIALAESSGKVVISETVTCADQALQLNGYGDRKKFFIKLYVASLYTQEKIDDESQLLKMQQALCMRLNITSSKITSEKMINATREGFEKSTKGNIAPIETEVNAFLSWLEQPIKKGDVFEFAFIPHNKTKVSKNGAVLGNIENKDFSAALYGIWLGDMPAQQDLKAKLLGK